MVYKRGMDLTKLKQLLEDQYDWPANYTFKFVGNADHKEQLCECVGQDPHKEQPSRTGKYISYTFVVEITETEEVLTIYREVSKISGIMSL
jgi:putative lipoic acid-binding regulatory protein